MNSGDYRVVKNEMSVFSCLSPIPRWRQRERKCQSDKVGRVSKTSMTMALVFLMCLYVKKKTIFLTFGFTRAKTVGGCRPCFRRVRATEEIVLAIPWNWFWVVPLVFWNIWLSFSHLCFAQVKKKSTCKETNVANECHAASGCEKGSFNEAKEDVGFRSLRQVDTAVIAHVYTRNPQAYSFLSNVSWQICFNNERKRDVWNRQGRLKWNDQVSCWRAIPRQGADSAEKINGPGVPFA